MKNAKSTPWAIGCLLLIASPAAAQKRPQKALAKDARIVLLHHSVGGVIWKAGVKAALARHNARHGTRYQIDEKPFPKSEPYGWHNNPYDYWTIWVKHAGPRPYKTEPTLEMLTRRYQVIVLKHCFTVSDMVAGNRGDVASSKQSLANYKLQYEALKKENARVSSHALHRLDRPCPYPRRNRPTQGQARASVCRVGHRQLG